jgi:hypothetical protein
MLKSQLYSEAMTCTQSARIQTGVAIMHFWKLHVSTYFLPFMRDLKWVWRRSNSSLNHLEWVLYKSYEACEKGSFLLSQSSRNTQEEYAAYIVKLPFKYPISCINIKIFHIYCQYVANRKKSKVNEIINWEK